MQSINMDFEEVFFPLLFRLFNSLKVDFFFFFFRLL